MRFRFLLAGREREVEVSPLGSGRFRIVADGAALDVEATVRADGAIRFEIEGRAHRALGVARGNERHLWVDGTTLRYEILRGARAAHPSRAGDLKSPTPGVVAEVLAAPGAVVRKGEKLVVLESMKMFFPVVAPRDGRVGRVLCARGETVDAGVLLVELEEEAGDGGPGAGTGPGA